jgi:hypothetical protein
MRSLAFADPIARARGRPGSLLPARGGVLIVEGRGSCAEASERRGEVRRATGPRSG